MVITRCRSPTCRPQMYAQIRAMHFLRFNTIPPTALLKDCGSLAYAFALLGGDPPKLPPQKYVLAWPHTSCPTPEPSS